MARPLLPDDLWDEIVPLLPPPRPRQKGGRRPIENRAALTGILFVLRSGLPWELLPAYWVGTRRPRSYVLVMIAPVPPLPVAI